MANVSYLHGKPDPIAQYLRIGHTGHRKLETLFAAGKLPASRIVVEAAHSDTQKDLLDTLRESGVEIVLDTNVAELSSLHRFEGTCKDLPWAIKGRPLTYVDFTATERVELTKKLADYAVSRNVDTILAPTHYLENAFDPWLIKDIESCNDLCLALEAAGGRNIAVDYPLIMPYSAFRNSEQRKIIISRIRDLPFDNIWLRISRFGADATAAAVLNYMAGSQDFLQLNKPIIADHVGGLAALAITSFGACGGMAHGVSVKERFDASNWKKPKKNADFKQQVRIYFPTLDRFLFKNDVESLFKKAKSALNLLACKDRDCCKHGSTDMLNEPLAHFLTQRFKQLEDLSRVPSLRRAEYFVKHHVVHALRETEQALKLRINDIRLMNAFRAANERIKRLFLVLENRIDTVSSGLNRSASPIYRGGTATAATMKVF